MQEGWRTFLFWHCSNTLWSFYTGHLYHAEYGWYVSWSRPRLLFDSQCFSIFPCSSCLQCCLSFSFSCVCAWAWCSTLCLSLIESLNALARHLFINLQHRKTPGSPVTRWRLFGYHRSSNDKASFTVMRSSLFPGVYSLGNLAFPLCPGATSHTSCLPACTLLCPGLLGLPCSSQKGCSTLMPPTWT